MNRYAYVVVRKTRVEDEKQMPEEILLPDEGVLYYDAEECKTPMSLLMPLLSQLEPKGITAENIDEVAIRPPFHHG